MEAPTASPATWSSNSANIDQDQALYRFLVDSLTGYAVFAVSPGGIIISWNVGAQKTFGYTHAEMLGRSFDVIFTTDDAEAGAPQTELAGARSGEQTQYDRWHVRKDGTRFWGTNTVEPLYDGAGNLLGYTKLVRDTTATYVALQALSDSEQQLRLLIESVGDFAIFSIALDGSITSWNAGAQKLFGYTQTEIVGREFAVLFCADDVVAGVPSVELRKAAIHGAATVERWMVRKNGSRFLAGGKLSQLKRDPAGDSRGFVKIAHDITEYDAAARDLRRRAQYDELTELPNRRTFYEHVQRAIASMKRRSSNLFAVLFIDLDQFKNVNDEFGHIVADQLLTATARRLELCVRSEDIVARIGGDEFAILLNGISDVADADEAADRIGIEMRKSITIDERDVRVSASVGIAIGNAHYDRPEDILRDADFAMYAAKTKGRARAVLFEPSMVPGCRIDVDLEADLRHAIERGEMRIAYQPIFRLHDTTIVGFEALLRWQHPRRGLIAPLSFIAKAENTDLFVAIDLWMIRQAAMQLAAWQSRYVGAPLQMSVNISSRELSRDDFPADLHEIVRATGLAPSCLRLEITESAVMEHSERTNALVDAIRAQGIELHVDDFGTGYSSLSMLQHIAVDALKIDSSFVGAMTEGTGEELVDTVISLAHRLHLVAIAEGIETTEQLRRLVELKCDFGQGFLFAAPLDAVAAERFLAERAYRS